ncbi:MAG: hypothetical protein NC393_11330 [Clostridium sp.]|nr:hypothetical protein [Clostridium sp.]MCM1208338.1 hypothetical protein [Ruminococcus sp.]
MELKLKDDTKNESRDNQNDTQFIQNDNYGGTQDKVVPNPVVINFDEVHAPIDSRKSSHTGLIIKLFVFIILAVIFMVIYKNVIKPNFTTTDITDYVKSDEVAMIGGLKLSGSFEADSAWAGRLPIFSNVSSGITVKSNSGIAIIYKNNKQFGIAIDGKGYKMFGVKIGDPEYDAVDNITFAYDSDFSILNDLVDTRSMSTYYQNTKTNELLVITVNGNSNRVVAVTYFYDGRFLTNTLDDLSD